MNKVNALPDEMPSTTHMFQFDIVGSVTKKRYLGEFVCKIPTLKDQSSIAKYEAYLNGEFPVYLNAGVQKLHKWIAYLKYTLTDTPRFWKESNDGFDLMDPNVIEALYDEVISFEEKWFKQIWDTGEESGAKEGTEKA